MVDRFIGSVFGNLVVTGIAGKNKSGHVEYSCHCSVCAKDPELFDDAIFRATKGNLVNRGILPCGCSKKPNWTAAQYRVLISRRASGKYTAVVPDDAQNNMTKVSCRCNAENCGHVWEARINYLLSTGSGCRKCAARANGEALATPEAVAIGKITKIANEKGWVFNGWKDGWKNARSKLLLECHCGHKWDPMYATVVNGGNGCLKCAGGGYDRSLPGTLYVYLWTHKDTKAQHLKYGISNVPTNRIKQQKRKNKSYTAKRLFSLDFQDGNIPANLEKAISEYRKTNNIANPVTKELFPDGHTETLPLSCWSFIANLIQSETGCRLQPL